MFKVFRAYMLGGYGDSTPTLKGIRFYLGSKGGTPIWGSIHLL